MSLSRGLVCAAIGLALISGAQASATDLTSNLTFVGIAPCRIVDTRAASGFTGQAGPPSLQAGVGRLFDIQGTVAGVPTQCGIPDNAVAIQGNFTAVNAAGTGNLRAWPDGGSFPTVAAVNFSAGQIVGNGSAVTLGPNGVNVQVNGAGSDFILDLTGYYTPRPITIEITDGPGSTTSTTPVSVASIYSANFRSGGHDLARLVARFNNNQQTPACTGSVTVSLVQRTTCSATTGGTILTTLTRNCGFKAWLEYSPPFTIPTGAACLDLEASVPSGTGTWRAINLELMR